MRITKNITITLYITFKQQKTEKSTYTKPDCLKTQEELQIICSWKEYSDQNGTPYWHNFFLNMSVWDEPEEYTEYKQRLAEIEKVLDEGKNINYQRGKNQGRKGEIEGQKGINTLKYRNLKRCKWK